MIPRCNPILHYETHCISNCDEARVGVLCTKQFVSHYFVAVDVKPRKMSRNNEDFGECLRDLREKVSHLQTSVAYLDKKMRCRNVVWKGIKDEDESYDVLVCKVLDVINNRLKLNWRKEDIEDVYRIGRKGSFDRPILMSVASLRMKFSLMNSKMKLSGTKIFIYHDLPYDYRMKIRKESKGMGFERNLRRY